MSFIERSNNNDTLLIAHRFPIYQIVPTNIRVRFKIALVWWSSIYHWRCNTYMTLDARRCNTLNAPISRFGGGFVGGVHKLWLRSLTDSSRYARKNAANFILKHSIIFVLTKINNIWSLLWIRPVITMVFNVGFHFITLDSKDNFYILIIDSSCWI